jgi:hypothetical protein
MAAKAVRCMQCGNRVVREERMDPAQAAAAKRDRLVRRYGLSEMQREILLAAADARADIFVCGSDGKTEGEVKAGVQRFYGDEAVVAIAALAAPGLIAPHGEDRFELTKSAQELIDALRGDVSHAGR